MYFSCGGPVGEIVATLRVCAPELDPAEVTRILGCEPTESHRKGDPVDKSGRGARRSGSWRLCSTLPKKATLNEHVAHLLSRVSRDPAAWAQLAHCERDIFCGLFMSKGNQGDVLAPRIAGMLAERGIALGLDIYGGAAPDERA